MKYHLEISSSAQRQFKKFPSALQNQIIPKLLVLESEPRPHGSKKLTAFESYRIRLGDYRVVYSIDDQARLVKILDIAHRKDVYR